MPAAIADDGWTLICTDDAAIGERGKVTDISGNTMIAIRN